jgi:hypothetical protein
MVLDFLFRIAPPSHTATPTPTQTSRPVTVVEQLRFSQKQADAIEAWKRNAAKAVEADKAPSKTALKKQEEKSKKKKLKKTKV